MSAGASAGKCAQASQTVGLGSNWSKKSEADFENQSQGVVKQNQGKRELRLSMKTALSQSQVTVPILYNLNWILVCPVCAQLIFLAGSTDVSAEDISALLSHSNSTISVYTYSLLGESTDSSYDADKERSVKRLREMARTSNGKFEVQ